MLARKTASAAASLALLTVCPWSAVATDGPYRLTLETGAVWQERNDERIPGDTGTRFSMARLQGAGPYAHMRMTLEADVDRRSGWRFLIAPLEIRGSGTLDRTVSFAGADFAAGTKTTGTYRFNSYRATYRYRFHNDSRSEWRAGVTLKIRDARVALRQGAVAASDANVGFAPLIHVAGSYALDDRSRLLLDFDGLAAPQGRAFDIGIQFARDVAADWTAVVGFRTLEGGADNERVYSFAWLNYATVGAAYRF
jgi:hypothetical protein